MISSNKFQSFPYFQWFLFDSISQLILASLRAILCSQEAALNEIRVRYSRQLRPHVMGIHPQLMLVDLGSELLGPEFSIMGLHIKFQAMKKMLSTSQRPFNVLNVRWSNY